MRPATVASIAAALYLGHLFCEAWTSSSQILLGLAVVAMGVLWWKGRNRPPAHLIYFPLAIYVVGSILSALFGAGPLSTLGEVSEAFTFLTVPVALALYARDPGLTRRALMAFALLTLLISLWGQFEWVFLGWRDLESRISGPAAHVMTLSGILVVCSLLMAGATIRYRSPFYAVAFLVSLVTLILTQTRGAWLGWLAGAAVLALVRKPKAAPWLAAAVLLVLIVSPTALFSRVSSVASLRPDSNFDRIKMIEGGVAMIRDHPVFGTGPGTTKDNYVLYRSRDALRFRTPHLHNNVIQIWSERGIMTLAGYLMLVGFLLWRFHRLARGEGESWYAQTGLAIVVGITVAGLFEYNFGDSEVMMTFLDASVLCLAGAGDLTNGENHA